MQNSSKLTRTDFKQHLIEGATRLGIHVSNNQAAMMEYHAQQLLLWNKKINLTAIKEPLVVAEKHFVDCLAATSVFKTNQTIMDIGSGGGFPGIPLKIMNPSLHILMVDSSRKKISFIKDVIRGLKLENINAVHARVEDLQGDIRYKNKFDAVISRAFSDLSIFVELAFPFITSSGQIHAMKGKPSKKEITKQIVQQFDIQTQLYELPFEKSERHILSLTVKQCTKSVKLPVIP